MAVKWTDEQRKVIDLRNRNILVSAAAGSGKTAVLVERIIKKITDPENPVDIDRILVVTFTKAAASEMRERISEAIEKLREENPEDENLLRQSTLIFNSQITTIDSFCLFVVRNHFGEINLDPNFRIADTGEIKLLELDALDDCFEENYARKDNAAFINLIDLYGNRRSDEKVRDMVLKIYRMSQSDSWPKEWIRNLGRLYSVSSVEELQQMPIVKQTVKYVKSIMADYRDTLIKMQHVALSPDGPDKYLPALEADIGLFKALESIEDYNDLYDFFAAFKMGNLAPIRDKAASEEKKAKKELVQSTRNAIKKEIDSIRKEYFSTDISVLIEQLHRLSPVINELIRLTIEYTKRVEQVKKEKRIVDFGDIEHFALQIFVDRESRECTATAREFRNHFEEIMIDEYQDSNQVQEDILYSISKNEDGANNMFMVGDVKQSIYRFRLARPELFMYKYNTYESEDSLNQKIDLHKNFRSRREVIEFTNDIFYKIMQADMGGVSYDKDSALYLGASYAEDDDKKAELLLIDTNDEDFAQILEEEDSKAIRIEALAVAQKINQMMQSMSITDKGTGEKRALRFSDIVILFRGVKANGNDFVQVLSECNIPAYVESQSGYFDAYEVQVILNMLRILDNPYQDIPMTAVLKSEIVGLDDEELAEIRIKDNNKAFCELVVEEMENASGGKLYVFGQLYARLRNEIRDTPIHEVIEHILEWTRFGRYAASMPAGKRRLLNLNMLVEKAIDYENTSYKGLFHFIRYIDEFHKFNVDFGEAETIGENDDVVHIMTIHKSKGLEFPVVFVSGTGRKFNQQDTSDNLVLHTNYGIGINEISGNPKRKFKCMIRSEIANRIKLENLGEELRVLYVALTRAKEKLIITGCLRDAQKNFDKYEGNILEGVPISFKQRVQAAKYLDWIIPAMLSYPDKYNIDFVTAQELATKEALNIAGLQLDRKDIEKKIETAPDELVDKLTSSFSFEYPYRNDMDRKSKYSVSELKHDSMVEKYDKMIAEAEIPEFLAPERDSYVPAFVLENPQETSNEQVNPGALRGTAVHRVMECLDFSRILEIDIEDKVQVNEFIRSQLEEMKSSGHISEDMCDRVPNHMLYDFLRNPIALRMAEADKKHMLFKEKPFVMDKDGVLIQGIIDVFWIENDNIVLLDYKTDRVEKSDELIARYKTQLDLYADALARIFSTNERKMHAEESLIYSFRLKEVIEI